MKLTINSDPSEVHFIADMHFNHENIIRLCKRPFSSLKEMHETMIENWNKKVKPTDTVFHLGDFSYKGSPKSVNEIVKRLNGHIYFCQGNHESDLMKSDYRSQVETRFELHLPKLKNTLFVLDHYPMMAWNQSHRGSIQLFGHVHGGLSNKGRIEHRWNQMDVGVDAVGLYRPLNTLEVVDIITEQFMDLQNKMTI